MHAANFEQLHETAITARIAWKQDRITKAQAEASIKPYITAWNALATQKGKTLGMRAPKMSIQQFLHR